MVGTTLYPLNTLKGEQPDLYASHVAKYAGREALLTRQIPFLNCWWNDVVQFSPVAPTQIRDALITAGYPWKAIKWFEIEPEHHRFSDQNTVLYFPRKKERGDFSVKQDDFKPYSTKSLDQIRELPPTMNTYFSETVAQGARPFPFIYIPHVLHRGTIDVSAAKVLTI